ncbi:glutaredoxin family protein [Reinekea marinisedimentorum]|uniref:Glutathione S-transferase-like protein n=1 Tax=Reinekea marinisedimentorum TaxID=230495 RepID=A0A4V2UJ55_9GAMM|nr:glutathione S-transferase N-terminal domain-containing protein [Reinekea marinisedimentorum]TCS38730.1 glutathione S-transferase-like protein [Reinekea marinisedimentorum]
MQHQTQVKHLSLYHYNSCPFCLMVKMDIKRAGLSIENRDIQKHKKFEKELIKEGGKRQVPCLRIEKSNGRVQWLYESSDIIQWLRSYQPA